jgi:hypothetical protein
MASEPSVSCGLMRAHATTLKKGRSFPRRIENNRRILPENTGAGGKVTQKATHSGGSGSPQDAA